MQQVLGTETPQEISERLEREEADRLRLKYSRVFTIGNEEKNKIEFPSNEIRTTKYHNVIFIYKSFLNQLKRLPILYFLIMIGL